MNNDDRTYLIFGIIVFVILGIVAWVSWDQKKQYEKQNCTVFYTKPIVYPEFAKYLAIDNCTKQTQDVFIYH